MPPTRRPARKRNRAALDFALLVFGIGFSTVMLVAFRLLLEFAAVIFRTSDDLRAVRQTLTAADRAR